MFNEKIQHHVLNTEMSGVVGHQEDNDQVFNYVVKHPTPNTQKNQ